MAMSVIFDSSPILSHRMSSGTHASEGTARMAPSVDPKKTSQVRARPVMAPRTSPSEAPMAKPTSTRWTEMVMNLTSSPRSNSWTAAFQTSAGERNWLRCHEAQRRAQLPQHQQRHGQDARRCRPRPTGATANLSAPAGGTPRRSRRGCR